MSKPLHSFALVLSLLLGMAAIPSMAAKPVAAPPPTFTNRVEFTTDGDGRVREAKVIGAPTDATNATVQQALLKKARDWRFEPFAWQGKPASSTFTRFIDVEIVPTTSGGFALRVKGVNKFKFAYLGPESLPKEEGIRYEGKHGQYLMVFRVDADVEGRPLKVERAVPDNRFPKGMDALVARKETMLQGWRQAPAVVDGTPVACTRVYVMQVRPDKVGLRVRDDEQGWYNDIDMARLLPKEVEQVRAVMAATNNTCPPPRMITVIEGALL